ncbi:MAG: hypothetical protein KI790_09430 [Cyclobacteriaceae bacterium]|nr:hypothetical protein [Cyclobacteriaceae bacterium HetDA_MAG_MS6]
MIKFLIICFLISYLFFKVGGYIFKMFFLGASGYQQQRTSNSQYQDRKRPVDGNLNIDHMPKQKQSGKQKGFEGGDYVDFEEVS